MKRPAGRTPADAAVLTVADCLMHMHASITSGVALFPVVITCRDKPVLRFQGVVSFFTMQNKANDWNAEAESSLRQWSAIYNLTFCKS